MLIICFLLVWGRNNFSQEQMPKYKLKKTLWPSSFKSIYSVMANTGLGEKLRCKSTFCVPFSYLEQILITDVVLEFKKRELNFIYTIECTFPVQ